MLSELSNKYNPSEIENKWYQFWEENKFFHAEVDKSKKPFTIVMPPPNVTAKLHIGHALDNTFQDIIIRYKRMQGFNALWIPGTDHAGIATQIKVEQNLREEKGLSRHDIGREEFLKLVWEWKEKYGSSILSQLKKIGSSCDWDRLRFTMDEGCSKAVLEVFVNLYKKGLIYKGNKIINWCPNCTTALSDAEVNHEEKDGSFWHIKYQIKDSNEYVIVATTRPETMFGDTAVAVHPEDKRYAHLASKTLILPIVGREIPIIFDEYVEQDFGTGCVKITPCHDPNDFEVGKRHSLPEILVIDGNGKMNENALSYAGIDRFEARKKVVSELEKQGLIFKIEPTKHNVGVCYRCATVVEPIASKQWFVKMDELAKPAINVVNSGEVSFIPDRFSKTYLNWMENVHDWCISRQLWWGHQIPAYYCDDCGHLMVAKKMPEKCEKCGKNHLHQDEDVLDTWFSSALWPISTLGWPEKTAELEHFYPTSVLVTAYDIIFFWVARMIFSGIEHTGKIPFDTVFIHGLLRDEQGRKMSKSLGNGVDPIEIINQHGADALRLTLAKGNSPGNDMRFYFSKVESSKNFVNKIFNAAKFIKMNLTIDTCKLPEKPQLMDKWILTLFNNLVKEVSENLDKYEIGIALLKLSDFIWDVFCDWYIELAKPILHGNDENAKLNCEYTLCYVLSETLKLLHPFAPFITEEIWQALPHDGQSIMISKYPIYNEKLNFVQDEADANKIINLIKEIRSVRAEMNIAPSKKAVLYIKSDDKLLFENHSFYFTKLAYSSEVKVTNSLPDGLSFVSSGASAVMDMKELINISSEKDRLKKEQNRLLSEVKRVESKLANDGFVSKAPESLILSEKAKGEKYKIELESIIMQIKKLDNMEL